MKEIELKVIKSRVYDEISKTTSYTGKKKAEDANAYSRIFTTEADQELLERFWDESKNIICNKLKKLLLQEEENTGTYSLRLGVSNSFDEELTESIERSMFSYFVMSITSKWYGFTNKEESNEYMKESSVYIEDIMRKVLYKKKPTRPTYKL